jgi:hypothetical protein
MTFSDPVIPGTTSPRHAATHAVDGACCAMMDSLTSLQDAPFLIDAGDELRAIYEAVKALHAKATAAHKEFEGNA